MSLEQAIQENTAAIRDLILAIKQSGAVASSPAIVVQADPHAEDDAYRRGMQAAKDAAVKAAETVAKAAKPAPKAEPAPAPADGEKPLRDQVRDLVFRIDKEISRAAALSVLKKVGSERVSGIADEKLQAAKEAAEALLKENESVGA